MFRGIHAVTVDQKGRLAIPKRYREHLAAVYESQLVVTIDTDSACLLLYPLAEWIIIEQKIQALPSFDPASRRIQRLLIGHATDLSLDPQGRILLPQRLRDHSDLTKNIVMIGQGKKFELWDETGWEEASKHWLGETVTTMEDLSHPLQSIAL